MNTHQLDIVSEYIAEFAPKLQNDSPSSTSFVRWPGFEFLARSLIALGRPPLIVETGTLRKTDDWLGYGQATMQFDWLAHKIKAKVISVDIDKKTCEFSQRVCKNVNVCNADSILFLRNFQDAEKIDLLYLDSFDWSTDLHVSSSLHHMGELAAIWDRLPKGCLVAVDDCHGETRGKHVMVRDFFKNMLGKEPLIKCHIQVWEK